jgi:hypothetical protein
LRRAEGHRTFAGLGDIQEWCGEGLINRQRLQAHPLQLEHHVNHRDGSLHQVIRRNRHILILVPGVADGTLCSAASDAIKLRLLSLTWAGKAGLIRYRAIQV